MMMITNSHHHHHHHRVNQRINSVRLEMQEKKPGPHEHHYNQSEFNGIQKKKNKIKEYLALR